jgi:2-keto-4-pentenoate hydratase/2-oxohepta-3-ene-1,7-dioic acid hydratase in catechol pathway
VRLACLNRQPALVEGDRAWSVAELLPTGKTPGSTAADRMVTAVRHWPAVRTAVGGRGLTSLPRVDLATARWDAPVPRPGKIIAAPINYEAHRVEMQSDVSIEQLGIFLKANSSVIGPLASIVLPFPDRRTDQEAELAVVIGARARHVPVDDALDVVMGYTCLLDISLRGVEDKSHRKSFDTFTPLGPWITTADEVGDPGDLGLRCWVNGELRQDARTSDLIYGVAKLVSLASSVMTLEPGDVIATGTPSGVAPLSPGDTVVVEIERVGRLQVGVAAAPA